MRNEFSGKLVLCALKNKKLLRLQKKLFLSPFLEFRESFCNFRNFVIKFYIKICLVVIMIFLFLSNEKLEKKAEQEKFIT